MEENDMKFFIRGLVIIVILIVSIVALGVMAQSAHNRREATLWNDGKCPNCGQKWKWLAENKYNNGNEYVYHCSNCNISIFLQHEH